MMVSSDLFGHLKKERAGSPEETVETIEQPDPTWKAEHDHFLALCHGGGTNLENDLWIQARLRQLAASPGLS